MALTSGGWIAMSPMVTVEWRGYGREKGWIVDIVDYGWAEDRGGGRLEGPRGARDSFVEPSSRSGSMVSV
jgi:hypothetical protein